VLRFLRLLAVCGTLSLALTGGCASKPPLLKGAIKTEAVTNPDVTGRASPVVVRVYELKSLALFNTADFFSLFEKERETLGTELVGREEYDLRPAETRPYQRQLQPDTRFIGVVAAFRDLEKSSWRASVAVPQKSSATLTIGIDAKAVTVVLK
jgi:type VI secretion system protein VasD